MPTTDSIVQDIDGRVAELKRQIDKLEGARSALTNGLSSNGGASEAPKRRGRPRKAVTDDASETIASKAEAVKTERKRGSGPSRHDQILAVVLENPGITAPQIAEKLGINRTQPHTTLRKLLSENLIVKDGKGYKGA